MFNCPTATVRLTFATPVPTRCTLPNEMLTSLVLICMQKAIRQHTNDRGTFGFKDGKLLHVDAKNKYACVYVDLPLFTPSLPEVHEKIERDFVNMVNTDAYHSNDELLEEIFSNREPEHVHRVLIREFLIHNEKSRCAFIARGLRLPENVLYRAVEYTSNNSREEFNILLEGRYNCHNLQELWEEFKAVWEDECEAYEDFISSDALRGVMYPYILIEAKDIEAESKDSIEKVIEGFSNNARTWEDYKVH